MARVTLGAPAMYADHHVLKVRQQLLALAGVEDVYASSGWQAVIVSYDEGRVAQADIEAALSEAGYGPESSTPILAESGVNYRDPAWEALAVRASDTNEADLRMSGEFRKY
ncbi:MAG: heavy-metal-associated domain-containing protein [Anaerolineae bacterium]|nr:heavy-metal-associated domain-containing protein [Anaerolineae bacterium]